MQFSGAGNHDSELHKRVVSPLVLEVTIEIRHDKACF